MFHLYIKSGQKVKKVLNTQSKSLNLSHHIKCFTYPWDIFQMSIEEITHRQHLERAGPFKNLWGLDKYSLNGSVSCLFRNGYSTALPIGARGDTRHV